MAALASSAAQPVTSTAPLLRRFGGLRVAVLGDVIYDAYLDGTASTLCREAPVPVVVVGERRDAAGGAANVAVNLAALGSHVELLGVAGDDDAGECVLTIARRHGVDVRGVVVSSRRRTLAKRRIMAGGQLIVRYDEGTQDRPGGREAADLAHRLSEALDRVDAVVISDYGSGAVSDPLIDAIGRRQPFLVVDAHDPRRLRRARPTLCVPSFEEAVPLMAPHGELGRSRADVVSAGADRILDETGAAIAVVTLDRDGAVVLQRDRRPVQVVGEAVAERCSAGAGDTFTGAVTLAMLAGADAVVASEIAVAAAGVAVGKPGTATCSLSELRLQLMPSGKLIRDLSDVERARERHRRHGRSIALANGCFDIMERSHIELLRAAKSRADVLVVAVNDDESIRRLKGPSRPINTLADRLDVLAAMECVDHVLAFDEDEPLEVIRRLRPDVLVKGATYAGREVPEEPLVRRLGGRLEILDVGDDRRPVVATAAGAQA